MTKKITSYQILEARSPEILTELVRKKMTERWQPLGGVEISNSNHAIMFYQTMVFYCRRKKTLYIN